VNRVYWQLTSAVVVVCVISAFLLGAREALTRGRRAAVTAAYEARLRGEALVGNAEGRQVTFGEPYDVGAFTVYDGSLNGKPVGSVFTVTTMRGYSGEIDFIVGVAPDQHTMTGIRVVNHTETPGLGANATQVKYGETDPWFCAQFADKTMDNLYLRKDDPKGAIDALTGATITSRAITERAREALAEYEQARAEAHS